MASKKELVQQKHKAIRKKYQDWSKKNYNGIRIYTDAYIYKKLSEEFFLATATIEKIIFYRYKTVD